jgi:hypothetical protein
MKSPATGWFLFLLLALSASLALADGGALPETTLVQDPRLAAPITVPAGVYYLPEIVERLARKTGVALDVRTPRGEGDDRLVVRFKTGTRLIDALNALRACVSYRGAAWKWEQEEDKGRFTYTLKSPSPPDRLANELNRWMEETFRAELAALLEALHMRPEDRPAFLEAKLEPLLPEESALIKRWPDSPTLWKGLSIFEKVVPPEEREAVLSSDKPLQIPFDRLPEEAKEFARFLWKGGGVIQIGPGGTQQRIDTPGYMRIECERGGSFVPPMLLIGYQYIGSLSYGGGPHLHRIFESMLQKRWLLDTDAAGSALEDSKLEKHPEKPADPHRSQGFEDMMRQFAADAPVSLVARLPSPENRFPIRIEDVRHQRYRTSLNRPGGFDRSTVKGYLEYLQMVGVMHKWRGSTLLLSVMDWMLPTEQRARLPWAEVKRLRAIAAANERLLPFRDALLTLAQAYPEQLPALVEELPEFGNLTRLQPLLQSITPYRSTIDRLISRKGLPLDDRVREALKSLFLPAVPEAVAFYVKESKSTIPLPGMEGRMITFGYVLTDDTLRPIVDMPRPPLPKPAAPEDE